MRVFFLAATIFLSTACGVTHESASTEQTEQITDLAPAPKAEGEVTANSSCAIVYYERTETRCTNSGSCKWERKCATCYGCQSWYNTYTPAGCGSCPSPG